MFEIDEKVFITLNDNQETESIWVLKKGDYFIVSNIPFFAKDIALDYLIMIDKQENKMFYKKTICFSGNSTYRIFTNNDIDSFDFFWKILEDFGCTFEKATENLYAVNVPSTSDIFKVYEVFELGEKRNIWEFEEGFCGHPSIFIK